MHGKGKNQNRVTITNQVPREKKILKKKYYRFSDKGKNFQTKTTLYETFYRTSCGTR